MYKMSSEARKLTQIKKTCSSKAFWNQISQNTCAYQWSLCYLGKYDWFINKKSRSSKFISFSSNKKLKVIAIQNILLKIKLENIKEK